MAKSSKKKSSNHKKTPSTVKTDKGLDKVQPVDGDLDVESEQENLTKDEKILRALKKRNEFEQDKSVEIDEKAEEEKARKFLKAGFFSKLPAWVRAVLIKYWFSAAVFFFIGFGTVNATRDDYDLIAAIGLVIGLLTDFIVTPFLKMCDGIKQDAYKFNLFDIRKKKIRVLNTLFNLLYAVLVSFSVSFVYAGINLWINSVKGYTAGTVTFLAEPFLFGLFYVLIDMAVLLVRNLIVKLIKRNMLGKEAQYV